jgi:hypothetical protein
MTNADLNGILSFVQGLPPRWKDVENYATAIGLPMSPAWHKQKKDRALHAAKGKEKFVQLCASYHGPEGKGDGPAAAALIDIWSLVVYIKSIEKAK